MNEINILINLGFQLTGQQLVGDGCGKYSNTSVDEYITETHRIFHWKLDDKFSIKNLDTTSTTMIMDFKYILKSYFNDICN